MLVIGESCPRRQRDTSAASKAHLQGNVMGYLIGLACFFAWLTHVFTCFAEGLWGFLIAGALLFPLGIFHGFYLWFN
jgi:hypothetical protein